MCEAHVILCSAYELYADPKSNTYIPPAYKSMWNQPWLNFFLKPLHRRRSKRKDSAVEVADMAERHRKEVKQSPVNQPRVLDLAERFKATFSRDNVRVHFIGVWCICPGLLSLPLLTLEVQGYRLICWHHQGQNPAADRHR